MRVRGVIESQVVLSYLFINIVCGLISVSLVARLDTCGGRVCQLSRGELNFDALYLKVQTLYLGIGFVQLMFLLFCSFQGGWVSEVVLLCPLRLLKQLLPESTSFLPLLVSHVVYVAYRLSAGSSVNPYYYRHYL